MDECTTRATYHVASPTEEFLLLPPQIVATNAQLSNSGLVTTWLVNELTDSIESGYVTNQVTGKRFWFEVFRREPTETNSVSFEIIPTSEWEPRHTESDHVCSDNQERCESQGDNWNSSES